MDNVRQPTPVYGDHNDIEKLHDQLNPTDVELLYSRLNFDLTSNVNSTEPLTADQQMLRAKLMAAELERQCYAGEDNYE
jgi:hypothetical protein